MHGDASPPGNPRSLGWAAACTRRLPPVRPLFPWAGLSLWCVAVCVPLACYGLSHCCSFALAGLRRLSLSCSVRPASRPGEKKACYPLVCPRLLTDPRECRPQLLACLLAAGGVWKVRVGCSAALRDGRLGPPRKTVRSPASAACRCRPARSALLPRRKKGLLPAGLPTALN